MSRSGPWRCRTQQRKIAPFGYYLLSGQPDSSQVLFQYPLCGNRLFQSVLRCAAGWQPTHAKCWATGFRNINYGRLQPPGIRMERGSPSGSRSASPAPVFWTIPLAGGPAVEVVIPPAVQTELAEASGDVKAGQQFGEYGFCWSPSGDAIFFVRGYRGARNLWKLRVDPGTLRATGIDRLTTGPGPDAGTRGFRRMESGWPSRRSHSEFKPGSLRSTPELARSKVMAPPITSPGRTSIDPKLSPDGTKVAYYVPHGESYGPAWGDVRNEVWVKSLVDGSDIQIPAEGFSSWNPLWSPDSMKLIYQRRDLRTGEGQLMQWSSQSHDEEPLAGSANKKYINDWSQDGKWLVGVTGGQVWKIPFPSSAHAETVAQNDIF